MMWIDLADPNPYKLPADAALPPPILPSYLCRGKSIAGIAIVAFAFAIAAATTPFASFETVTDINTVNVRLDLWSLCGHYSPPESMPALLPWMGAGGSCLPITSSTISCDQARHELKMSRCMYLMSATLLLAHLVVAILDVAGIGSDKVMRRIHLGLGAASMLSSIVGWIMTLRFPLVPSCGNPNPIYDEAGFRFGASPFLMIVVTVLATINVLVAMCVSRPLPPSPNPIPPSPPSPPTPTPPSPNHHHHHHHHGKHHHHRGGHHHHHHHHHHGDHVSLLFENGGVSLAQLAMRPKHIAFTCLAIVAFALSIAGIVTKIATWTPPATPLITSDTSASMSPWFVCTSFNMSASMHESCWYMADPQAPAVCNTYMRLGRGVQIFYSWTSLTLLVTAIVSVVNYLGMLPHARAIRTCLAFKCFVLAVIAGSMGLAIASQSYCDDKNGRVPKASEQPDFAWGPSGFLLMAVAAVGIAMTILSANIDDDTEEAEDLLLLY